MKKRLKATGDKRNLNMGDIGLTKKQIKHDKKSNR